MSDVRENCTMPASPLPSREHDVFRGVEDEVPPALAARLRDIELVDHHVHGTFAAPVDRAGSRTAS